MPERELLILGVALAYDLILGEVPIIIHPVVYMGRWLRFIRTQGLKIKSRSLQLTMGFMHAFGMSAALYVGIKILLDSLVNYPVIHALCSFYFLTTSFAIKALGDAGKVMENSLAASDLTGARFHLRSLCSRDASNLSYQDLCSASVASLAENFCDSIVAPLFYYSLFGIPGAITYRFINTMDATLGYRGNLEYLGKGAAIIDDLANLIPARISSLLLIVGAMLHRQGSPIKGIISALKFHHLTPSPNGGWPMASMAGILGVQIEKKATYHLFPNAREANAQDIKVAWEVVLLGTMIAVGLLILIGGVRLG